MLMYFSKNAFKLQHIQQAWIHSLFSFPFIYHEWQSWLKEMMFANACTLYIEDEIHRPYIWKYRHMKKKLKEHLIDFLSFSIRSIGYMPIHFNFKLSLPIQKEIYSPKNMAKILLFNKFSNSCFQNLGWYAWMSAVSFYFVNWLTYVYFTCIQIINIRFRVEPEWKSHSIKDESPRKCLMNIRTDWSWMKNSFLCSFAYEVKCDDFT